MTVEDVLLSEERIQLQAFLDAQREDIAALADGLTDDEARRRLVPSATSIAAIIAHCAFVEAVWFSVSLVGRTRVDLGLPEDADDSWVLPAQATVADLVVAYRSAWAESDRIAASYGLDAVAEHNRRGPLTLRWIYLHMIEELARHAGHGDIIREQLLAARSATE